VFQPLLYFKKHLTEHERAENFPDLARHAKLCRDLITSGLAELKTTKGIEVIDLSGLFDDEHEDIFLDGIHLRQRFSDQIASKIFERIVDLPARQTAPAN
jgi:hypothetical protein